LRTSSNFLFSQRNASDFAKRRGLAGGSDGPPDRAGPASVKWYTGSGSAEQGSDPSILPRGGVDSR